MSLNNWPLLGQPSFSGLENYRTLATDTLFWSGLLFTTRYTLMVTPAIFILAFILAMLVNQPLRGVSIFRTAYFIPIEVGLGTSSRL